jgi:hypothetical protein
MIEKIGSIWDVYNQFNNMILVTTNSQLKKNGELVMGKGIALEAAQREPSLPRRLGHYLINQAGFWGNDAMLVDDYYIVSHLGAIGALQTKRDWKDPSSTELIKRSLSFLSQLAIWMPLINFNIPRPGCGNGGLNWEKQVKPLCEALPDNVVVWNK